MSRPKFGHDKRARETNKTHKRQEKEQRRLDRKTNGPRPSEIISVEEITGALPSVEEAMAAIEHRATAPRAAPGIPARLFVGSLADDTNAEDLRIAFGQFGPVADVIVMVDRETRISRGFGFVTMEDRRDATKAIDALQGHEIKGRALVVNVATERQR